jgi:hypothetical protein
MLSRYQGWNRYTIKVSLIFDIDISLKSIADTSVDIDIYKYRYSISILRLLKTACLAYQSNTLVICMTSCNEMSCSVFLDQENMGLAFEITFLCSLQADTAICSPVKFRKSHESASLNSKWLQNGSENSGLGSDLTPD